jgi:hypothetical protein
MRAGRCEIRGYQEQAKRLYAVCYVKKILERSRPELFANGMRILDTPEERERELARSPIRPLEHQFRNSAFRLAPENEENLIKIRDILRVQLVPVVQIDGFYFEAFADKRLILFSIRTIERIWAFSYCFAHMLLEAEKPETHDLLKRQVKIERPIHIAQLLKWAHTRKESIPWPEHSPKPKSPAADDCHASVGIGKMPELS